MRTRNIKPISSHAQADRYTPQGQFFGFDRSIVVPSLLGNLSSSMDDVSSTVWNMHDCWHNSTSWRYEYSDGDSTRDYIYLTDSSSLSAGYYYPIRGVLRQLVWMEQPRGRTFLDSQWGSDSLPRALTLDRDPFDTGFSLWYLIVDLIDLKKLLPQLLKLAFAARNLSGRKYATLRLGDFKEASNAYLLEQFGIEPTLDDIKQFVTLITKWREVYDHMDELTRVIHRVRENPVSFLDTGSLTQSWNTTRSYRVFIREASAYVNLRVDHDVGEYVWHGSSKYKFTCPEAKGWLMRLKQFIDAFGLLDPAAIWDVIPFSFLVDWVVGVGNWLHVNRPQLFPAEIVLQDYCESISYEANLSITASYVSFKPNQQITRFAKSHLIAGATHRLYWRKRGRPRDLNMSRPKLSKSFITLKRASIGAALLGQRLIR